MNQTSSSRVTRPAPNRPTAPPTAVVTASVVVRMGRSDAWGDFGPVDGWVGDLTGTAVTLFLDETVAYFDRYAAHQVIRFLGRPASIAILCKSPDIAFAAAYQLAELLTAEAA